MEFFHLIRLLTLEEGPIKAESLGELCRIVRHLGSGIVSECHTYDAAKRSESLGGCLDPWVIRWPITFSRNLAPEFTQYLCEQTKEDRNL